MEKREICAKMRKFVDGTDQSLELAGEIEVGLDSLCGDREPFTSLVLALASYQPGGGEFLYDAGAVVSMMAPVMKKLCDT